MKYWKVSNQNTNNVRWIEWKWNIHFDSSLRRWHNAFVHRPLCLNQFCSACYCWIFITVIRKQLRKNGNNTGKIRIISLWYAFRAREIPRSTLCTKLHWFIYWFYFQHTQNQQKNTITMPSIHEWRLESLQTIEEKWSKIFWGIIAFSWHCLCSHSFVPWSINRLPDFAVNTMKKKNDPENVWTLNNCSLFTNWILDDFCEIITFFSLSLMLKLVLS